MDRERGLGIDNGKDQADRRCHKLKRECGSSDPDGPPSLGCGDGLKSLLYAYTLPLQPRGLSVQRISLNPDILERLRGSVPQRDLQSRQHFLISGLSARQELFDERVLVIHSPYGLGQAVILQATSATIQVNKPREAVVPFTLKGRAPRIEVPVEKPVQRSAWHRRSLAPELGCLEP